MFVLLSLCCCLLVFDMRRVQYETLAVFALAVHEPLQLQFQSQRRAGKKLGFAVEGNALDFATHLPGDSRCPSASIRG